MMKIANYFELSLLVVGVDGVLQVNSHADQSVVPLTVM